MIRHLLNLFRKAPQLPAPKFVQVGGRLLNTQEWSEELIEALKKEYFMPTMKDAYLMRVDLSAICPESHTTTDRIGIFSKRGDLTKTVANEANRLRIDIFCRTCGKVARITGKRVVWQGDLGTWDGVV